MLEIIKLIFIGIILGIANVIPGLSGGTIAASFGIYEKLINILTINVKKILSEYKFILPLLSGTVLGIIFFSKIINFLFEKYSIQTNYFFIGIILGSIPMLIMKIKNSSKNQRKNKIVLNIISASICSIISLCLIILLTELQNFQPDLKNDISTGSEFSILLAVRLFFGLGIAAAAMIIPGISGSFIMLVLGIYSIIINAISNMYIPLLIPACLGAASGLLGGAVLIRFLLKKAEIQTYGFILGLVAGSVYVLFPGIKSVPAAIICSAAGFLLTFCSIK